MSVSRKGERREEGRVSVDVGASHPRRKESRETHRETEGRDGSEERNGNGRKEGTTSSPKASSPSGPPPMPE